MFWADKIAGDISEVLADKIKIGKKLIIRDEKTASGRVHIGSMRGVAVHGLMSSVLKARGIDQTFLYEINDFDPMDGLPSSLPVAEWEKYLGLPLNKVPSPDGKALNFAEYYADEFKQVIAEAGFTPEYYRASELYTSGKMNGVIKEALDHADDIRRIYKEVSGSQKNDEWLPISVVCESCGKVGTTHGVAWDGTLVSYKCIAGSGGSTGCGHEGKVSPYDGRAKLPWKAEWPAKWTVVGVDIEGAGKDHSTKGGSRDVAAAIAREVFNIEPPFDIPYEFFLDKDGKKMSSSKGRGSTSREIADILPQKIFRLALIGRDPMQALSVDPNGDAVPFLFDWFDKIAEKFWDGIADDDARLFELVCLGKPPARHYLPRFSSVAFIVQMKHIVLAQGVTEMKGSELTHEELAELHERGEYAQKWLAEYASEKYRFTLQTTAVPEAARSLSELQKGALRAVLAFVEAHANLTGEALHKALHEIKGELNITPKDLFGALYLSFLGRDSGPQAGWFLATLDRDFLIRRLQEVTV